MSILGKIELVRLYNSGDLRVETLDKDQPFDPEQQITEDAVDLRLSVSGLRYRAGLKQIDTLFEANLEQCFEVVRIPAVGYHLRAGETLFTSTLEVVCLSTSKFSGRVVGRTTFARFGLSIHCMQPKFPSGLAWAFPLQLVNHNVVPLVIYPYSYVAQLQIETTFGEAVAYEGKYDQDITLHPPKIDKRELLPLSNATDNATLIHNIQADHVQRLQEMFKEYEQRDRKRSGSGFSRRSLTVITIVAGAMSAGMFGYAGNLLATSDTHYYKNVLTVVSLGGGVVFLLLLIACSVIKDIRLDE